MTLTLERDAAITFPPVGAFANPQTTVVDLDELFAPEPLTGTDFLFPFTEPEVFIPEAVEARTEKRLIIGGLLGIVICIEAIYFVTLGVVAFSNYVFADWYVR